MHILVSGLANVEANAPVRQFPVDYYPIDYPFFGVNVDVSGVGVNVAKALTTLGDSVDLCSYVGDDACGRMVLNELADEGIDTRNIRTSLKATPTSVVLHDPSGRRQIYCDLKDIQDCRYPADRGLFQDCDIAVLCNIAFNRDLLGAARAAGVPIATDVHTLSNVNDEYNHDFIVNADVLFLSNEAVKGHEAEFLQELAAVSPARVLVMGCGEQGVCFIDRSGLGTDTADTADVVVDSLPACHVDDVVNTVGAGDALFAAFVHYRVQGLPVRDALQRAQAFAALKIRVDGAAQGFVSEEEVESFLAV
ncbi:carbohydrate kinase family protein [Bifidobacterium gallicum]|uniref:Kinase, PfkB family n=1 Tax=Bifidobacterium gallicum DSM 20093 = LMG 11596 TaxID=561180 RepID=D1NS11_9BIFI|nr:carbohydrate kinase family protein [Bifidobacterium gallicum]EFA23463.1 kinase, PfkB family [Bifidobacterium gallicum DSM 20093 = LMG 11596]KFI57249.1 putative sugar kinase [Bifidobacterium gallicum DSM 20093 = LMG 11596]